MLEVERTGRVQREMAFKIFQAQKQTAIHCFAQAVHQCQIAVARFGLAGINPLDLVATNPLANLR
ncbi:hypothetical protein D3C85_1623810 [compost metagenome]